MAVTTIVSLTELKIDFERVRGKKFRVGGHVITFEDKVTGGGNYHAVIVDGKAYADFVSGSEMTMEESMKFFEDIVKEISPK